MGRRLSETLEVIRNCQSTQLEAENAELRSASKEWEERCHRKKKKCKALDAENQQLKEALQSLRDDLRTEIQQLTCDSEALQQQRDELCTKIQQLTEVSRPDTEDVAWKQQCQELEIQNQKLKEALQNQLCESQQLRESFRSRETKLLDQHYKLQGRHDKLQAEHRLLTSQFHVEEVFFHAIWTCGWTCSCCRNSGYCCCSSEACICTCSSCSWSSSSYAYGNCNSSCLCYTSAPGSCHCNSHCNTSSISPSSSCFRCCDCNASDCNTSLLCSCPSSCCFRCRDCNTSRLFCSSGPSSCCISCCFSHRGPSSGCI